VPPIAFTPRRTSAIICRGRTIENELWRLGEVDGKFALLGEVDGDEKAYERGDRESFGVREEMDMDALTGEGIEGSSCSLPVPGSSAHVVDGIRGPKEVHDICGDEECVNGRAEIEGAMARR